MIDLGPRFDDKPLLRVAIWAAIVFATYFSLCLVKPSFTFTNPVNDWARGWGYVERALPLPDQLDGGDHPTILRISCVGVPFGRKHLELTLRDKDGFAAFGVDPANPRLVVSLDDRVNDPRRNVWTAPLNGDPTILEAGLEFHRFARYNLVNAAGHWRYRQEKDEQVLMRIEPRDGDDILIPLPQQNLYAKGGMMMQSCG